MIWKSMMLIVIPAIFFLTSLHANSAETVSNVDQGNVNKENTLLDSEESALDVARLKIENAINSYKEGDMAASERDLQMAIESLNKAANDIQTEKAREETRKLGIKIDEFKEKLNQAPGQHENMLIRFWHQTISIIKREKDHLIHSYIELSVSEKTLKYLLDAKMHLFMAQHDLFVSHNDEEAMKELDNVLDYLDDASQVAKPSIKKKVINLSKNIQALKEQINPGQEAWRNNDLVVSLNQASDKLTQAKSIASPQIKLRIESLETEIQRLRVDVERSNIKNDYELSIVKLRGIINEL
jgi:hypothetical protein